MGTRKTVEGVESVYEAAQKWVPVPWGPTSYLRR